MTVRTENLRRTADFMKRASGVDPVWLREAASEIDRLREAVDLTEKAEDIHANCNECGGEGAAEECEHCFPSADDARIARRAVRTLALPSHQSNCTQGE